MTPVEFKREVIRPVIKKLDLWSVPAEELLLGTAIHESGGLKKVRQFGGGPALSYFQMEPATLYDLHDNFLAFRPKLKRALDQFQIPCLSLPENLTMNLAYAAAAARLQYYRAPEALPKSLEAQADYWKKYWNTAAGKGSPDQYLSHYKHYI